VATAVVGLYAEAAAGIPKIRLAEERDFIFVVMRTRG
jgi:hypothetical protein